MPLSITVNLPTMVIAGIVAALFLAIVIRGIVKRRRGETGCGRGCSGCPNSGLCHSAKKK